MTKLPETDAKIEASKNRLRLWLRLMKTSRNVETKLREKMRSEFGSTLPRFDVLAALSRADTPLKMSQLSSVLRVSTSNVTGLIDRLVDDGLVERTHEPNDRRVFRVGLTDLGKKQFAQQATAHEEWIDSLFANIASDDALALSDALLQIETD